MDGRIKPGHDKPTKKAGVAAGFRHSWLAAD
jgi:hypothetical protein